MDEAPYRIIVKVFNLISKAETKLTEKETAYIIGQLESLIEMYSSPEDAPSHKKNFLDKFKG